MKKIRKYFIILIGILFSYGIIANIQHMVSVRQTYEFSFDESVEMLSIKKSVIILNQDIEQIKKIENSLLTKEVLDSYIQVLENLNQMILNCNFMNYEGKIKLKQKDLYQMLYDYGKINYINMLNVYKKIAEVNPTLANNQQELTQQIYTMLLFSNYMYETLINNYAYTNIVSPNQYIISTILSLYEEKLNTVHDINQLVLLTRIEGGEVYE